MCHSGKGIWHFEGIALIPGRNAWKVKGEPLRVFSLKLTIGFLTLECPHRIHSTEECGVRGGQVRCNADIRPGRRKRELLCRCERTRYRTACGEQTDLRPGR